MTPRYRNAMFFIKRFSNIILICLAVFLGIIFPKFGSYIQPVVVGLVIFLIYGLLRGFQPNKVVNRSNLVVIFLSFGFSYFLLPVAGGYFTQIFFSDRIFIGFVILLIAPTTAVSAVWTRFSEGDEQLATTITVGSVILSPVILPILLKFLLGSQTSVPVVSILIELLTVIIAGAILTVVVPSSLVSKKNMSYGSRIALFAIIYSTTSQVGFAGFAIVDLLKISSGSIGLFIFGVCVFFIADNYIKIPRQQLTALFFSSNMKNLGIALLVSGSLYPEPMVITTIVTYFLIQQVGSAIIADFV